MIRDTRRSDVYAAEDSVFDETLFTENLGMEGVADLADVLFSDQWWVSNIRTRPQVTATRRESHHSWCDGERIALSIQGENAAVLGHEAAHYVQIHTNRGVSADHGPEFRAAMLDVFELLGGAATAERLTRSYADRNLVVGSRHPDRPRHPHRWGVYGLWRLGHATSLA